MLVNYQNNSYSNRYLELVQKVINVEKNKTKGLTDLSEAVAKYYYKLLAYKDEYEVARLYTNGNFTKSLKDQFEGKYKLKFHLAPPLFGKRDAITGQLIKRELGPWMMSVFKIIAK